MQKYHHALIADDSVAVYWHKGYFYCAPSFPYSRPYRELETLGTHVEKYTKKNLLLDTLYFLRFTDKKEYIDIAPIQGMAIFQALQSNTLLYTFPYLQTYHLQMLGKLVKQCHFFTFTRSRDLTLLDKGCYAIIQHRK